MSANQSNLFDFDQDKRKELFFPVELRPVYVSMPERLPGELFDTEVLKEAQHFKAVIDIERHNTFAVVSSDYEIILNTTAIELAKECFKSVFKLTDHSSMQLFNIVMPATRSFCNVDFIHKDSVFDFGSQDPWCPFLRVTNSYNRTKALKFDLGFCRGICRNGLIFGKRNIEFKFTHSKSAGHDPKAEFDFRAGEFAELEKKFIERLGNLARFHVAPEVMWALLCKVFGFQIPHRDSSSRAHTLFESRQNAVAALTKKYFVSVGHTGYAALNVLSDFATRPPREGFTESRIHGFQATSGKWVTDFVDAMKSNDFSFDEYLGEYLVLAA